MTTDVITPLRQRMIEDMTARRLGPHSQRSHIYSCKRFAAFLKRSPDTATLEDIRRRTRDAVNGPTRVLRRLDESGDTAGWPTEWPLTITHACRAAPEDYAPRVRDWAKAVSAALA